MSRVLAFFATREWQFSTGNVQRLRKRLSPKDLDIYNLDIRTVDWDEYAPNFEKGVRKYVLREKDDNLTQARRHMDRLRFVHYIVLLFLSVIVLG